MTSALQTRPTKADLPSDLTDRDQWVCWKTRQRNGKATKVPIDPATDTFASTTEAETWSSFETARAVAKTNDYGLGFVFTTEDPLVGVDLDDCRETGSGKPTEQAKEIINQLESYTEVSPSGTGYHVLLQGDLPADGNRSGNIEMYDEARFFTMTGRHVSGTPEEICIREDALAAVHIEYISRTEKTETDREATSIQEESLTDEELLSRACAAANGDKFQRLWDGDTSGYQSHSEADMALCCQLAFWTGGNRAQIDRLFRQSGLMREKWDETHYSDGSTYGETTVKRALERTDEFYTPSNTETTTPSERQASTEQSPQSQAPSTTSADRIESLKADVDHLEAELAALQDICESLQTALTVEQAARDELEQRVAELEEQADRKQENIVNRLLG